MNGLQQVPYDEIKYYYRLKKHKIFCKFIGIKFKDIFPRMTRDFEIIFKDEYSQKKAYEILSSIKDRNNIKVFNEIDYLITPTTPTTSFKLGSNQDLLTMYLNDVFTVPASLAGIPGISLPIKLDKQNLPIGIQILGKDFDENGLLNIANVIENCANFKCDPDGAAS